LAELGANVALVARRRDRLDELAAELGERALVIEADVTSEAAARDAVEQAVAHFGRLDTVVASAGVMLLGPIVDAPMEDWERMIDLNFKGSLYIAHAALPHLLTAASGGPRSVADLVLISSTGGRAVSNGSGIYNATKHAIGAFGESLRQEVSQRHVRVSLIEPGAVATELTSHLRDGIRERTEARFEDVELLTAEDIADIITFTVTRPRRVAINEVMLRPSQAG
jgi:NADP-dependent 3-hydroxy acid dehydrogenase YdfG